MLLLLIGRRNLVDKASFPFNFMLLPYVSITGKPWVKLPTRGSVPVQQMLLYTQEKNGGIFRQKLCTDLLSLFTGLGPAYTRVLHRKKSAFICGGAVDKRKVIGDGGDFC